MSPSRKRPSKISSVLLLSLPALAWAAPDADIRASFDRYRKAIRAQDGAAAARELDDNTSQYYAGLRSAALSAPDVHGLPLLDKMIVLRLRHELSPDQLSSMDGRSLLAYTVSKRWIDSALVEKGTIGKISVSGDRAIAGVVVGGKPSPLQLLYRKQAGGWRLDLTANNLRSAKALTTLARTRHLTDDELAVKMVEEATGRPLPTAAWRPLVVAPRR